MFQWIDRHCPISAPRSSLTNTTDYDWKVHPVIHIDFSLCACVTHAAFMREMPAVGQVAVVDQYGPDGRVAWKGKRPDLRMDFHPGSASSVLNLKASLSIIVSFGRM